MSYWVISYSKHTLINFAFSIDEFCSSPELWRIRCLHCPYNISFFSFNFFILFFFFHLFPFFSIQKKNTKIWTTNMYYWVLYSQCMFGETWDYRSALSDERMHFLGTLCLTFNPQSQRIELKKLVCCKLPK